MSQVPDDHPLLTRRPPDWLASIPISTPERMLIDVGAGKAVAEDMLREALEVEIGSAVTSFSAPPRIAELLVEFTERPEWRNLPAEPTAVRREADDRWKITVGDHEVFLDREEIEAKLSGQGR